MKKNNYVAVYGCGRLGMEVLEGLALRGVPLYNFSYGIEIEREVCNFNGLIYFYMHYYNTKTESKEYRFKFLSNIQVVDIVDSSILRNLDDKNCLIKYVNSIVVILTGDVLLKEIDFLLTLKIPLVICSIDYDKDLIRKKSSETSVSVFLFDIIGGQINVDEIYKAIRFLKNNKGQFSGLDLLDI